MHQILTMLAGCIKAINQWDAEKHNVSLTSVIRLGGLAQTKYKVESLTKNNQGPCKIFQFFID